MPLMYEEFTEGIGRMAEQECQRTRREMGLPLQPSKATLFIGCANEPCREKCPFKGASYDE